jgi:transcriptional regulator with XRE-family HTH domain
MYETFVSISKHLKHFFRNKKLIDLNQVKDILSELVPKKGKSNAEVGRKLGISGQLLGQYINGRQKPKAAFYIKWKRVFGEDLIKLIEGNVSNVEHSTEDNESDTRFVSDKEYEFYKDIPDGTQKKSSPSQTNWDDLIEELKENNRFLRDMVKTSLPGLARGQLYLEAHLKVGLHQVAELRAPGNSKKKTALMAEINTDVADQFQTLQKRGSVADT